jgi:predicted sulfurtransferase
MEGLNCTLTGGARAVRAFCQGLRDWKPSIFRETDFKISDCEKPEALFKALTIRKTDELVAYGLGGAKAPQLVHNKTRHVEAHEYHAMMEGRGSWF